MPTPSTPMPSSKHTPGPWVASKCIGAKDWTIGSVQNSNSTVAVVIPQAEDEANARLISAAPDLLRAIQLQLISTGKKIGKLNRGSYEQRLDEYRVEFCRATVFTGNRMGCCEYIDEQQTAAIKKATGAV